MKRVLLSWSHGGTRRMETPRKGIRRRGSGCSVQRRLPATEGVLEKLHVIRYPSAPLME